MKAVLKFLCTVALIALLVSFVLVACGAMAASLSGLVR